MLRELSASVLAGDYRPGPRERCRFRSPRAVQRTLRLANVVDRVLGAVFHHALQPYWETVFVPWSFGFRPNRGTWALLAQLEADLLARSYHVLAVDDIAKAFDNVVLDDVLNDHARHINDDALLQLITVMLRGRFVNRKEERNRSRGRLFTDRLEC